MPDLQGVLGQIGALPTLIAGSVRTARCKIEYRALQTATREPEIFTTQQKAAYAAGAQKKTWHYIELFYNEQGEEDSGYVTEKYPSEPRPAGPGLNLAKWQSDRSNPQVRSRNRATPAVREQQRPHRHAVVPDRENRRRAEEATYEYSSLEDPKGFEEAIEQAAKARPAMSARTLRITLIVLTVIGVGLASYLTYIHYADVKPLCGSGRRHLPAGADLEVLESWRACRSR